MQVEQQVFVTRGDRKLDLSLLRAVNTDAIQHDVAFQVPPVVWEALRDDVFGLVAPWMRHRPVESASEKTLFRG